LNYLAHAYLSFDDPEILLGNMISDFVKGRKKFDYPLRVQKGIGLHRAIDSFTDDHPATKEAKEILRPAYRLYSGAFVDVIYDHFLATDKEEFSEKSLFLFSQQTYQALEGYAELFPERFARMFPYMRSQDWLYNYREKWGTVKSFEGLVHRARYIHESGTAHQLFEQHYQLFQNCYRQFWKELKAFALNEFQLS
jgi:acyl carrier protein phosphodiesterase